MLVIMKVFITMIVNKEVDHHHNKDLVDRIHNKNRADPAHNKKLISLTLSKKKEVKRNVSDILLKNTSL